MQTALNRTQERTQGSKKGAIPVHIDRGVKSFIYLIRYLPLLRKLFRLESSTLELFLFIVSRCYVRNIGCSTHWLCLALYKGKSGSAYRSIQYRLVTLRSNGLIRSERKGNGMLHYLTDKAKEMLVSIETVEL